MAGLPPDSALVEAISGEAQEKPVADPRQAWKAARERQRKEGRPDRFLVAMGGQRAEKKVTDGA